MALTDNLISYWKCDETSGTTLDDAVTTNDLTTDGTVNQTGIIGKAVDYERDSAQKSYIADASQTGLDITGDFSISAWIKLETIPSDDHWTITAKQSTEDETNGYYLIIFYNDKLRLGYGNGSVTTIITDSACFSAGDIGNWVHVVVSVDVSAKTAVFYKNNSVQSSSATATGADSVTGNAYPFSIGSKWKHTTSQYIFNFDGLIDEVGIWSRILSAAEVGSLYNSGAGLQYPFTIAYSMIATVGSFSLTSVETALKKALKMAGAVGSFTLTSIQTVLKVGHTLTAALGSFTLTGIDAALKKFLKIAAATGSFALTSVETTLKKSLKMAGTVGSFTLTGIDATIKRGYGIAAAVGSFTLTGINAAFSKTLSMTAALGSFALTGIDVVLKRTYIISVATSSFTVTGINIIFKITRSMAAAVGAFTLTGINVTLTLIRKTGMVFMRSKQQDYPIGMTQKKEDYPIKLNSKQQNYPLTFDDNRTL